MSRTPARKPRMPKNNPFSTLRVIAGNLKGRKLISPHSSATHPMGAREKNALFNMVDVSGKRVLDAYAGSGALGIEALSRGASDVTFVESHYSAVSTIKQNLADLGLVAEVFPGKIAGYIAGGPSSFDIIIADPPYDKIDLVETTSLSSLLTAGGTLALSSPATQPTPEISGLTIISSHTYAEARITTFVKD